VIKQKMCLSPTVEDHVRYAQQHIDLGFTHLYYHCAGPDQRSFLERYGREVLPKIKQGAMVAA
jgi:coenzyme F420-dependent glucose-6-phosphate dehydrogenase